MVEKMRGTVRWFCTKGYGKVLGEDKQEYFIHYKQILGEGFKMLEEGQTVKFNPALTPRGYAAHELEMA